MSEQGCSARRNRWIFMEWSFAVVWTCLLGARLVLAFSVTTSETVARPRLIGCVFMNRANVTCHWEPGDTSVTNYTLEVRKEIKRIYERTETASGPQKLFICTTSGTSCTANMKSSSVRFSFCVTVTAHSPSGNTSTHRPCQSGVLEVRLPAVNLISVKPVKGKPRCLNITWNRTVADFSLSDREIKDGNLKSQIEFTAQGKSDVQVTEVTVKDFNFQVCLFRPDTSYSVRLRHSYQVVLRSPWSPWSNAYQGRTGEDAPSAAPALWRRVKQIDENGWRVISLLWKPLLQFLANGRVLLYNVTCQTENAQVLSDLGSCSEVHSASTSCSLRLPAERCSCALTASTSAGTSPEARIWFLGSSETEPPPPSHITATPLDDNSLDVRWTAPDDRSVSGFVVEWFAVREKKSSIVHWERLNSSSTALVITEGVEPMERYAVSVKALYGDRGAGQNRTVHNYTRQGAPSAGPDVRVQQISSSTVDLSWSPVPVELRRGFIRNYIVSYSTAGQPTRTVFVPGDTHHTSLSDLLPGDYNISMQAYTDGGAGAAGLIANVHISEGSADMSILMYTLFPLLLTSLALVLMVCLAQTKMVKQKLCPDVPDPSNSSLSYWTPKIALETMKRPAITEKADIKYSEVIMLGGSEPQNHDPDKDLAYQSVCNLQTYSSHPYSPLPAQTPENTRESEKHDIESKTASAINLSSYPSIYSSIVLSQTPSSPPAPSVVSAYPQSNGWLLSDVKLKLGGDSEPPVSLQGRSAARSNSPLSQMDELETLHHLLRRHQSPVTRSDFSSISKSSVLLSRPAEVKSARHPFSQSLYHSVPSLQPDPFGGPDALSDTFTTSLTHSVCVDFSYYPLE